MLKINYVVFLLLLLSSLLFLQGCDDFHYPLSNKHNMLCPQELNGTWKLFNSRYDNVNVNVDIYISPDCKTATALRYKLDSKTGEIINKIKSTLIFSKLNSKKYVSESSKKGKYDIFYYEMINSEVVMLYFMDGDKFNRAVYSREIERKMPVPAKSSKLQKYVRKYHQKIFEGARPLEYRKQVKAINIKKN